MEAGAIYSENGKKLYESTTTSESRWFSRFIMGEKQRMGVLRRQDEALTFNQLLFIGDISEEDWSKSNYEEEKKELESTIAFTTIYF